MAPHTIHTHIQRLAQQVRQLFPDNANDQKIYAKFDRTLFSENGQTLAFYRAEIEQNIARLQALAITSQQAAMPHYQFLSEKIATQCAALHAALNDTARPANTPNQAATAKGKQPNTAHPVHRLPPRERLDAYYHALQRLTEKHNQAKDAYQLAATDDEKACYFNQMQRLAARRAACLDAIELLEDYLAFKQEQAEARADGVSVLKSPHC